MSQSITLDPNMSQTGNRAPKIAKASETTRQSPFQDRRPRENHLVTAFFSRLLADLFRPRLFMSESTGKKNDDKPPFTHGAFS